MLQLQLYQHSFFVGLISFEHTLVLAKENTERNGLRDRVSFVSSDWFERVDGTFDLIVSNPPYLNDLEWKACEPEIRNYEPKTALVSEPEDSAADLKRIVETASPRIRPGGLLALETGENHHAVLVELATKLGYLEARGFADLRGRPRFFFARRPD